QGGFLLNLPADRRLLGGKYLRDYSFFMPLMLRPGGRPWTGCGEPRSDGDPDKAMGVKDRLIVIGFSWHDPGYPAGRLRHFS
ncbi:MAG: hypothetical protein AAGB15_03655, partial [Pseudomonadota bacterium]